MKQKFSHRALELQQDKPLIFTALSKHLFYFRMFICKFVLEQGGVPINPFMVFDYFLLDTVDRDLVRQGNNNLVKRCDQLWVFGAVSDGVLAEIQMVKASGKPVRYFSVINSQDIVERFDKEIEMELEVKDKTHLL